MKEIAPDLAALLDAYERELANGSFTDWSGVLELATDAVRGSDRHRLIGLPTVLLDVPVASEAERCLANALAGTAPTLLATVAPAADIATIMHFLAIDWASRSKTSTVVDTRRGAVASHPLRGCSVTFSRNIAVRPRSRLTMRLKYFQRPAKAAKASRSFAA